MIVSPLFSGGWHSNPGSVQGPGAYSSGRWLRHDRIERAARYIEFDFEQLCQKVLQVCHTAHSIRSWEKKEGGYNQAFIFTLDNARRVVARLPARISGPAGLTTHSEVATIEYCKRSLAWFSVSDNRIAVQSSTTIPIPKILAWNDSTSDPIGAEYIIMEHAAGCQLHECWPAMSIQQRIACVGAIVKCVAQTAAVKCDVFGSLYFDSVDIDDMLKSPFAPGYIVGPHCGSTYWDCDIREPRYYVSAAANRGPCM